jgi:hypothetical protein
MCDFHSVLGVAIGDKFEIIHDSTNSHSGMAGTLVNKPNRKAIIFEAEWNGVGEVPPSAVLIRNNGECPERLEKMIRAHYVKVKEALATGAHLNTYFKDTKKWADVWNAAIKAGAPVVLPAVFSGDLWLYGDAKLDAAALTNVGGYLWLYGDAKLEAAALTSVGGDLVLYGDAKLEAAALKKVNGKPYKK